MLANKTKPTASGINIKNLETSLWVIVIGPPYIICSLNNGKTDPAELTTFPNLTIENLVLHQFNLCKSAGLDGIVCSAKETILLKDKIKNLEIICPGIRFANNKTNDQKRITTAKDAFYKYNASAIVIGRPITQGNIKKNLKKLIKHLK